MPRLKYASAWWAVALLVFVSLAVLVSCQPGEIPASQVTPSSNLEVCTPDNECTLALRIDLCCTCPVVVTRAVVEADKNLVYYFSDTDYRGLLPSHCQDATCGPCPPLPEGLFCENGSCDRLERQP